MKLKAGMVLRCTTGRYKCVDEGAHYTVYENRNNEFSISCNGVHGEGTHHIYPGTYMIDFEEVIPEPVADRAPQENKMVRYKVERVIQITQEAIIEVEMPTYIKDAYVMDQVVDEAIAYSHNAKMDIPWENVGKQDIIRTKKTRIKDEPVEGVHKYECPKCKAEAHNQHHDECEYYGEGPK